MNLTIHLRCMDRLNRYIGHIWFGTFQLDIPFFLFQRSLCTLTSPHREDRVHCYWVADHCTLCLQNMYYPEWSTASSLVLSNVTISNQILYGDVYFPIRDVTELPLSLLRYVRFSENRYFDFFLDRKEIIFYQKWLDYLAGNISTRRGGVRESGSLFQHHLIQL